MHRTFPLLLAVGFVGCDPVYDANLEAAGHSHLTCSDAPAPTAYRLDGPCVLTVSNPTRLAVTTTDFSTGALSIADVASHTVESDVALASTDAVPSYHDGALFLINRWGLDYITVLDAEDYSLISQHPVTVADVSTTNPHAIAFRDDGLAFVTLFGAPEIQLFDFSRPSGYGLVGAIDMRRYADPDGNPELDMAVACGSTIFVTSQQLDESFLPTGAEMLIPIDAPTCTPTPGEIDLLGHGSKQLRVDPTDPSGQTLLVLSNDGLEQVDLAAGTTSWVLAPALFAAASIGPYYQTQAFALHADATVYLAAYTSDFAQVEIWRAPLSGATALEKVLGGFNSVEKVLEIVGDELWVGDTTFGASGLRVFDLTDEPPSAVAGPLSTGLPPYAMIPMP